jgi:hypothetical protein
MHQGSAALSAEIMVGELNCYGIVRDGSAVGLNHRTESFVLIARELAMKDGANVLKSPQLWV